MIRGEEEEGGEEGRCKVKTKQNIISNERKINEQEHEEKDDKERKRDNRR